MAVIKYNSDGYLLYNTVILPNIDSVWMDKQSYPYAVVVSVNGSTGIYTCSFQPSIDANGELNNSVSGQINCYLAENGSWTVAVENEAVDVGGLAVNPSYCVWTSHNILNTDGTTYLAASEPLNTNAVEWDGDTTGLETMTLGEDVYYRLDDSFVPDQVLAFLTVSDGSVITITSYLSAVLTTNSQGYALLDSSYNLAVLSITADCGVDGVLYKEGLWILSDLYSSLVLIYTKPAAITEYSGDGFVLCNGAKIPALPEWDKTAYPYYFIVREYQDWSMIYGSQAKGWTTYIKASNIPKYKSDVVDCLTICENTNLCMFTTCDSQGLAGLLGYTYNEWGKAKFNTSSSIGDIYDTFSSIIWTSYDIMEATGEMRNMTPTDTVAMAASSEPIISLDGMWIVEWNGDTTDLVSDSGGTMYKLSDTILKRKELIGANILHTAQGTIQISAEDIESGDGYMGAGGVLITASRSTDTLPEAGTYAINDGTGYVSRIIYTPAGVEPYDPLKDWLTGWLYGMVGRRLFIKKKSDEIVTPDTAGMYLYGTPSETGNIGLRNGDTVTMYDGWVMPALPQWDKTVYPYACIWGHPVEREFSVLDCTKSPLHFEYTRKYIEDNSFSTPLTLPDNGTAVPHISFLTTTNGVKVPATKADEFTPSRNGAESVLPNGLRITLPVVWSNYNFCYSDGELYVPKSKPIPVNLVGHNYNGVVLSPEFEDVIGNPNYVPPNVSTEFPYWVLSPFYVGGLLFFYEMRMFSRPVIVDRNDIITADGATVDFLLYEEGRGCSLGEGHPSDWNFAHHSSSNRITVGGIKWANFDLLNKDGSIYIAKSDAIPIYE